MPQFSAEDSQDYHDQRVRGCCTASLCDLVAGVQPPADSSRPDRDLADLTSPSAWHRVKRCTRSIGSELTPGHVFLAKLVETWYQSNGRCRSHLLSQWIPSLVPPAAIPGPSTKMDTSSCQVRHAALNRFYLQTSSFFSRQKRVNSAKDQAEAKVCCACGSRIPRWATHSLFGTVSPRKPHSPRKGIIGPQSTIRRETRLQAVSAAAAAAPSKA